MNINITPEQASLSRALLWNAERTDMTSEAEDKSLAQIIAQIDQHEPKPDECEAEETQTAIKLEVGKTYELNNGLWFQCSHSTKRNRILDGWALVSRKRHCWALYGRE